MLHFALFCAWWHGLGPQVEVLYVGEMVRVTGEGYTMTGEGFTTTLERSMWMVRVTGLGGGRKASVSRSLAGWRIRLGLWLPAAAAGSKPVHV